MVVLNLSSGLNAEPQVVDLQVLALEYCSAIDSRLGLVLIACILMWLMEPKLKQKLPASVMIYYKWLALGLLALVAISLLWVR